MAPPAKKLKGAATASTTTTAPRRPTFWHAGKECHTIATLSTSNVKNLTTVLDTFGRLCVPVECSRDSMVFSGTAIDVSHFIYFKVAPMKGDSSPAAASAPAAAPGKRKRPASPAEDEEEEEDEAQETLQDVADDGLDVFRDDPLDPLLQPPGTQTKNDFYKLYDERECIVQVDMFALNSMLKAAKRAVVLSISIFSYSPTGCAERILVKFWDSKSTTSAIVLLQDVTIELFVLNPIETTFAITMPAAEFASWVKEITSATQGTSISMHMSKLHEDGGAPGQRLTLTAVGDNGEISKVVTPDAQSGIRFDNDLDTGRCRVDYLRRYSCKPIVQVSAVAPVSRNVRIYLSGEAPLKLQFQVPDIGMLYFFLAPKIEDDATDD